jgi:hypothetical protein
MHPRRTRETRLRMISWELTIFLTATPYSACDPRYDPRKPPCIHVEPVKRNDVRFMGDYTILQRQPHIVNAITVTITVSPMEYTILQREPHIVNVTIVTITVSPMEYTILQREPQLMNAGLVTGIVTGKRNLRNSGII